MSHMQPTPSTLATTVSDPRFHVAEPATIAPASGAGTKRAMSSARRPTAQVRIAGFWSCCCAATQVNRLFASRCAKWSFSGEGRITRDIQMLFYKWLFEQPYNWPHVGLPPNLRMTKDGVATAAEASNTELCP